MYDCSHLFVPITTRATEVTLIQLCDQLGWIFVNLTQLDRCYIILIVTLEAHKTQHHRRRDYAHAMEVHVFSINSSLARFTEYACDHVITRENIFGFKTLVKFTYLQRNKWMNTSVSYSYVPKKSLDNLMHYEDTGWRGPCPGWHCIQRYLRRATPEIEGGTPDREENRVQEQLPLEHENCHEQRIPDS